MFINGVGCTQYVGAVQVFVYGVFELSLEDIDYPVFIISRAN